MLTVKRLRVLGLVAHVTLLTWVLDIVGVGHLVTNPIVLGAILLSYYDLWIK